VVEPYTLAGTATTTSFLNAGLTNGTTYFFVVSAVNATAKVRIRTGGSANFAGAPVDDFRTFAVGIHRADHKEIGRPIGQTSIQERSGGLAVPLMCMSTTYSGTFHVISWLFPVEAFSSTELVRFLAGSETGWSRWRSGFPPSALSMAVYAGLG